MTQGTSAVAISPDGRRFASASRDGLISVWDIATGREVKQFSGHANGVSVLAWSPDGRLLASASYDSTARIWDLSPDR
jgi:WD40 repeat protein